MGRNVAVVTGGVNSIVPYSSHFAHPSLGVMRPMRPYIYLALTCSLAACGNSDTREADSVLAATPNAPAAPSAESGAPAAAAATPIPAASAAPITGTIIEVQLIGDAKGYRFEPQKLVAKVGDGVKFVVMSGGPHEIAFDLDQVPAETKLQLLANMPNGSNGRSPLLSVPRETWTLSLGALKPGKYPFVSTPRLPQGMKGELEIQ